MSDGNTGSALGRMAARGRAGAPAAMTRARALGLAVSKAAEEGLALSATAAGIEEREIPLDALADALEGEGLICLLESDGARGVASVDMGLLAGLIEQQTTGRVVPGPPEPRLPTPTDAALCGAFVDGVFRQLAQGPGRGLAGPCLHGYRLGQLLEEPRKAALLLEQGTYLACSMTVDLASGAKEGRLMFAVPLAPPVSGAAETDGRSWHDALAENVMGSAVRLDAVIHRLPMRLDRLAALAPGETIALPADALERVALTTADGRVAGHCTLGQARGLRALRLNGAKESETLQEPPRKEPWPGNPPEPAALPDEAGLPDLPDPVPVPVLPEGGSGA